GRTEDHGSRPGGAARTRAEVVGAGDHRDDPAGASPRGGGGDLPPGGEAPRDGALLDRSGAAARGPLVIAADTSSMIAFLQGDPGDDTDVIQSALDHQQLALPPVVLTELLSDPAITRPV